MWIPFSRTLFLLLHSHLLHYTNCAIRANRPIRVLTTRSLSRFVVSPSLLMPQPLTRCSAVSSRLSAMLRDADPSSFSAVYVVCGRRTSKIKGLLWEGDGFLLFTKRVEDCHFSWPRNSAEARKLTPEQFDWLMKGFSIDPLIKDHQSYRRTTQSDGQTRPHYYHQRSAASAEFHQLPTGVPYGTDRSYEPAFFRP